MWKQAYAEIDTHSHPSTHTLGSKAAEECKTYVQYLKTLFTEIKILQP